MHSVIFFNLLLAGILLFRSAAFPMTDSATRDTLSNSSNSGEQHEFRISIEYRPRTELRLGYRVLPGDTTEVAFFTSHRARINFDLHKPGFNFHATIQETAVWGDSDPAKPSGKIHFYEIYAEPFLNPRLTARIGRQRINCDNQRLFSENNWRQAGGYHNAARLMYRINQLSLDLIGAFNQASERLSGTSYNVPWQTYKSLVAGFLSYRFNSKFSASAIAFTDGYTDEQDVKLTHYKYTTGGRITYDDKGLQLSAAGYIQQGHISTGEQLIARYWESEVKWFPGKAYTFRLGAQFFSGDSDPTDGKSQAFMAQYGASHRHNGGMDYTASTVRTNNHEGIVNPYLIQDIRLGNQLKLTWESHLLFTQKSPISEKELKKFYGWENDFKFRFIPNDFTEVELGMLVMAPGETLEYLPAGKTGSSTNTPWFAYIMMGWKPELLKWNK